MAFHSNGTTPTGSAPIVESRKWSFAINGVSKLVERWAVNTANLTAAVPAYQSPHSTVGGLFVSQEIDGEEGDCGITYLTVTYEGYTQGDGGGGGGGGGGAIADVPPVYSWNGTLESRQIQLHPKFRETVAYVESEGFDPTDSQGRFVGFPLNSESEDGKKLEGITSYLNASGTWSKSWIQAYRPVLMSDVGYVGTPPGDPPTFTDDRQWLVGPITYREAGGVFECNQIWLLSEPGGFSTFYTA